MTDAGPTVAPASAGSESERGRERDRFLRVYMNDQLALGVMWREVAKRAQRNNDGTALGDALERVAGAIADDVETFKHMMDRLGIAKQRLKPGLAMAAERFGRLKFNGRLREYSPLSRFEELDFLRMGIDGKVVLWQNLRDLAGVSARLPDVDFDHLVERAGRQRTELESFRAEAGRQAFRES